MTRDNLHLPTLLAVALAADLIGCGTSDNVISSNDSDGSRVTHSERLQETVHAGGALNLVVKTENGRIVVRASDHDIAEVEVTKKVKSYDREAAARFADDVVVTVERRGDVIEVATSYPTPPDDVDVAVDFEISVPADLSTELELVNGSITIVDMENEIAARTTSGTIDVRGGSGSVDLAAVNGLVSADISDLQGEGRFSTVNGNVEVVIRSGEMPIRASTLNGSVSLTLPGHFDGSLDAQTANGQARSEFSVTGGQWQSAHRISGSIGSGGDPEITLRSTNGNVWLRKAQ